MDAIGQMPQSPRSSHRTPHRTHRTPEPSDTTGGVIYPQSVAGPKEMRIMTVATMESAGLVGTITADPELHFSASGTAWTKFRISVKPFVKGAEVQPDPEYFEVVCFGSLAEHVAEVLSQGDRVAVVGRIESDDWTGKDGVVRSGRKVVADGIGPDLRFSTSVKSSRTARVSPLANSAAAAVHVPTPDLSEAF
jgi:single-strand DNA-binding protein